MERQDTTRVYVDADAEVEPMFLCSCCMEDITFPAYYTCLGCNKGMCKGCVLGTCRAAGSVGSLDALQCPTCRSTFDPTTSDELRELLHGMDYHLSEQIESIPLNCKGTLCRLFDLRKSVKELLANNDESAEWENNAIAVIRSYC
jgi:hypothetical protein